MPAVAVVDKPLPSGRVPAADDGTEKPSRRSAGGSAGRSEASDRKRPRKIVDLDRYVPAFMTWIANKLSRGASQHYLAVFNVGIETWRCLVLLAVENSISAQQVSKVVGMDKASVSRCFKSMQSRGLITLDLDSTDGRLRMATLTKKGRALHDQILGIALERERALLSVLTASEKETLIKLLKRLHENLPEVERATDCYVSTRFPGAKGRPRFPRPAKDDGDLPNAR
jgi:DNA-binding MarR family transcriptional regulator